MKRSFIFIGILILIIFSGSFNAVALSDEEIVSAQEDASGLNEIAEALPSDTSEALEGLGIDPKHPTEGVKRLTLSDLFSYIGKYISEAVSPAFRSLAVILGVIFVFSVFSFEKNRVIHCVAVSAAAIALIAPILTFLNSASSSMKTCASFITGMVPVFSSFMLSGGLAVSSGILSGCILLLSRGITTVASSILLPIVCSGLSLSAVGAFVPELKTESIASSVRKFAIWTVGAILVIYLTFLGIQSGITSSLDGLAQKTAKLTVSSAVPIVGSIISDASDTVFGAAQLIKSGIGGFSFVVIILIFIKPLLCGIAWMIALKIAEFAASSFGSDQMGTLAAAVQKSVSVVIAMLAASCVSLIISIAVMVKLRM